MPGVFEGVPSPVIQKIIYPNGRLVIVIATEKKIRGWHWDHIDFEPFDIRILDHTPVPGDAEIEQIII